MFAENIEPLSKIKFVNDSYKNNKIEITDKLFLNKYIRIDKFEEQAKSQFLPFSNPTYWADPYEQLLYNIPEYNDCFNFPVPDVQCYCLTTNGYKNEDAMWSIYRYNSKEPVIKITYNFYELLKQLNTFCENKKFTIYIGKVDYSLGQKDLKYLLDEEKNYELHHSYFPEDFDIHSYLRLLLLKRKQFDYEGEIRMFLVSDLENFRFKEQAKLKLDYESNNLISSISIAPTNPFDENGQKKKDYKKENTINANAIKEKIHKIIKSFDESKIQQSHLYEDLPKLRLSKAMEKKILERDNYRCIKCSTEKDIFISINSKIRMDGFYSLSNSYVLCKKCNMHEGKNIDYEYLNKINKNSN